MKKLVLLTAVSLTCLNLNAKAMDGEAPQKSPARAPRTMSAKQELTPKTPITTGFFDKTLSDTTIEKEEKLKRALEHVTRRKERYDLFLEQIGVTYFRTKFLQDDTLKELAIFMMSYFEEKVERLEKKHIHFQAYLEPVSELTINSHTANPIGKYSGKYHGDQEAQAEYAHTKINLWDLIFRFVDKFPPTKVSTSPIIQRAIEEAAQKRVDAFGKIWIIKSQDFSKLNTFRSNQRDACYVSDASNLATPAKQDIDAVALQHPVRKLNDMIHNSYDLKLYAQAHLKKWHTRIGEKQKINMLGNLLKNLNATHNEL